MTTPENDHGLEFVDPSEFDDFDDVDSSTVELGTDDWELPATSPDDEEGCD